MSRTAVNPKALEQIRAIITAAKLKHATGVRTFVNKLNAYHKFEVISPAGFSRFEKTGLPGGNKQLDMNILNRIAPFTYNDVFARPYTFEELVAISDGKPLDDAMDDKLSVEFAQIIRERLVANGAKDKEHLPVMAALIGHMMDEEKLTREEFAVRESVSLSRINAILDDDVEPTSEEYDAIAQALNRGRGLKWNGGMLKQLRDEQYQPEGNGDRSLDVD